jgi:hypothetical protein
MINTYKGQKLLSKRQIKQALAAQKDKLVENCLKTTNWNWTDWGCPAKLPIQKSKPHPSERTLLHQQESEVRDIK